MVEADKGSPQKLWRSVDVLFGRSRSLISSAIDVETFNMFFSDEVAAVRSATDGANEPSYTNIGPDCSWSSFTELTTADVVTAIHQLPDKSSAANPIPVSVLKQIAVQIAPFLTKLFNLLINHRPLSGYLQVRFHHSTDQKGGHGCF
jgi:hypothetical protein